LVVGARILGKAGITDPRRESLAIWAGLAESGVAEVWSERNRVPTDERLQRFAMAVERRADGEPMAYAVGSMDFRYLSLRVDSRVLIPRPETEGLVDHVLAWGESCPDTDRGVWGIAADVGTGSGCIALSLAVEGKFERVIATDVSSSAIAVARTNRDVVHPYTAVEFRLGYLLEPLDCPGISAIVSNPPYVAASEYARLDRGVRDHEPREALVSGAGGMEHTLGLLQGSRGCLTPGGLLAIEVDSTRAQRVLTLARELGWDNARLENDSFGYPRYLLTTKES
jgi:release factor glutamine methyltransferase